MINLRINILLTIITTSLVRFNLFNIMGKGGRSGGHGIGGGRGFGGFGHAGIGRANFGHAGFGHVGHNFGHSNMGAHSNSHRGFGHNSFGSHRSHGVGSGGPTFESSMDAIHNSSMPPTIFNGVYTFAGSEMAFNAQP